MIGDPDSGPADAIGAVAIDGMIAQAVANGPS